MRTRATKSKERSAIGQKRPAFALRACQAHALELSDQHRMLAILARRQIGKTTIASRIALRSMMRKPGHTVVFGSVKLDLGREIVRKESEAVHAAIASIGRECSSLNLLHTVDVKTGTLADNLGADDFAELYESQRLEFRLYHSRSVYSRTKVVALTPSAVGETGDLILDEVGRVRRFDEVWEAVLPFIASNPDFRCLLTTTPPPDDTHFSFDLLAPPIDAEFDINPRGNLYTSEMGVKVLQVTADDAFADGIPLYDDDSGLPIDPATARSRAHDKDSWDRNYACKFVLGGTSACGLMVLDVAQRRGVGHCQLFSVDSDSHMREALEWIRSKTGKGAVGIGVDTATTQRATSNPTAVAVCERSGAETIVRAVVVWKTRDPHIATERIRAIVDAVKARPSGGSARRLAIDATGERYFAESIRRELGSEIPVELVVASESIHAPGMTAPTNFKQYLGSELVGELDDNHLWLPPERYLREDFRLVKKERGMFTCEADGQGRHGDTFDAVKLGLRALRCGGLDEFVYSPVGKRMQSTLGRAWS